MIVKKRKIFFGGWGVEDGWLSGGEVRRELSRKTKNTRNIRKIVEEMA